MTVPVADNGRLIHPGPHVRQLVTRERLVADLRALGVPPGRPVLVHASLSRIGQVDGGAQAVVDALREVLGPRGTLVTGAGTPENSPTSRAFHSRVAGLAPEEVEAFKARMPAFNRTTSQTSIGAIAEALRTTPGAKRSAHPQSSFAAIGRRAGALMSGHRVKCHLGESSPLAKLYRQDALILLIGVGYQACSAFHLAEYRYRARPPRQVYSCVIAKRGRRRWFDYWDVALDDSDFGTIGEHLEEELKGRRMMRAGQVGSAPTLLIPMRQAVDIAGEWMAGHRPYAKRPRQGKQRSSW
jgi:aminoglycoside 3-N-acetyltransferase